MEEKNKCIASFQLEQSMLDWLKEEAKEECSSISSIIRRMILKAMREKEENK